MKYAAEARKSGEALNDYTERMKVRLLAQGLPEYGLLLGLMALLVIGGLVVFGQGANGSLSIAFNTVGSSIAP